VPQRGVAGGDVVLLERHHVPDPGVHLVEAVVGVEVALAYLIRGLPQ
jgi:hypothetical protein